MNTLQSLATIQFPDTSPRNRLERLLAHLADVRAGEGAGVLLLALNLFMLLAAYYMLKTVREALILTQGGAEVKTYSSAGQAILLLAVVPLFGAIASRVNRVRLVTGVTLFFASNLAIFVVLGLMGIREGVPYFLWVGIFNVMVIAQLWAFANDLYTRPQGERLFPIIGLGSSLGAWLGAVAATKIIGSVGPYGVMTAGGALLVACAALTWWIDRRHVRQSDDTKVRQEAEKPLNKEGGFQLIFHDRYLLLIAALTVLLNVVNTSGEFLLGKLVVSEAARAFPDAVTMVAERQKFIGEFYGTFFGWVNVTGLVLQTFFVSRIFKAIGPAGALFILSIALTGYSVILAAPILGLVRVLKIMDNSTDYSIENTARQALFLPTSREAKYKAKAAIDTFFVRLGDVVQAAIVYAGTALGFVLSSFAALNLAFTVVWFFIAAALAREYKKRSSATAPRRIVDVSSHGSRAQTSPVGG